MVWDDVVAALLQLLQNDEQLKTLLGGPQIYRSKSRASIQIPGVYYTVVSSVLQENLEPTLIQWDIWAKGAEQASSIEKRLYQLMHSDVPVTICGLKMWSQYEAGRDDDPDQSTVRRLLDYRYTPARLNG